MLADWDCNLAVLKALLFYLYYIAAVSPYFWTSRPGRRVVGVSMASSWPPDDDLAGGPSPRCTPAAPAPSGGSGPSGPPGS